MSSTRLKQISLRLPERMYQDLKKVARRRQMSINKLASESLAATLEDELASQLQAAYDELG
jgi:predicted DNA-binding ribbon-helix-helix protein